MLAFDPTLSLAEERSLTSDDLFRMLQNRAPKAQQGITAEPDAKPALTQQELMRLQQNRLIVNEAVGKSTRGESFRIEERRKLAEVSRQPGQGSVSLEINFEYNSASITPRAAGQLAQLGKALKRLNDDRFLISGHTDSRGGDAYNLKLSQRRAGAIRDFLISAFNLAPEKLIAVGFGEEQPKNLTDRESAENRRVEIVNLGQ